MKIKLNDEMEIVRLTHDGYTQQAIADHFLITRGRVSQILAKNGIKRGKRKIEHTQN